MRDAVIRSVVLTLAATVGIAGCAPQRQASVPAAIPSAGAPEQASGSTPSASPPTTPSSGPGGPAGSTPSGSAPSGSAPTSASPSSSPGSGPDGTSGRGAAKTPDEHREGLDRDLDASLAAFDAMLLKEQQEVAAKRAEHGTGGAGAGSGGEGEGGESAGGGGSAGGGSAGSSAQTADQGRTDGRRAGRDSSGRRGADRSTGSSNSGDSGEGGREVATAPEGTPTQGEDSSRVPADVGDGRDDDIVARQLREAAVKEEDPTIREKLWDEYRRYKRGGS